MKEIMRAIGAVLLGVMAHTCDAQVTTTTNLRPTLEAPAKAAGRYIVSETGGTMLRIELTDLERQTYPLLLDGEEITRIFVDFTRDGTAGSFEFATPPVRRARPLTFDPKSTLVEVLDPERRCVLLSAVVGPPIDVPGPLDRTGVFNAQRMRVIMTPPVGIPTVRGLIRVDASRTKAKLKLTARGLAPSVYALTANGLEIARRAVDAKGTVAFVFSTKPKPAQDVLGFDPTSTLYSLHPVDDSGAFDPDDVALSARVPGNPIGRGLAPVGVLVRDDTNADGASVIATVTQSTNEVALSLEFFDLEEDTYRIVVDGITRLHLNAKAAIETAVFSSNPLPGDIPLLFDPRGALVTIERDGLAILRLDLRPDLEAPLAR